MELLQIKPNVLWSLGGVFFILVLASLLVFVIQRRSPEKDHSELVQRVKSWWIMIAIFTSAMMLSRNISILFFGFISYLALKEFLSMVPTRRADRRVLFWAYLTIPVQFYLIGIEWYGVFIIFIPVYIFLFLPTRMVLIGETDRFLKAAGTLHWGLMLTVFCFSHVAYLLVLPDAVNPNAGSPGLVLYLVFLTQFNDVAQYTWGKLLGKRKIVPTVSPKKTWEGFIGGLLTTTVLATILSGVLTPLTFPQAALAGVIIGGGGFVGDIIISALKRDIGVKDSGNLLPGHGGILDRIDSLMYTAPLFFHYVFYLHF